MEGLGAIPLDKEEPDRDLLAEKMRLEADLVRAEQVFARFQERCLSGEVGDQKNPQVKAWVENKRKDLIAAIWDLQRQLEHFVDDRLAEQRLNASVREVQEALRWTAEEQLTLRVKREIIEQLVRKVIVHLEPSITLRATHATRNSGLVSAAATR